MSYYGDTFVWKIVFLPKVMNNGQRGVALVEAADHQQALYQFAQQHAGEYHTIESCKKLLG
jgi:hypothetical protein